MEKEILGSEAPLKKEPRDMTQTSTKFGMAEILGSEAPISRTPVDMTEFWKGGSTDREILGSQAPLSTREHHGWESHGTPMSARSLNKANKGGKSE
jgi:hypothetical protein